MLDFTIVVILCSSWPPNQEQCIVAAQYELKFEEKEHCILLAGQLASLVPVSLTHPMKGWNCLSAGETT